MPPSREEKLHHTLAAIAAGGSQGVTRAALETWIQTTFRSSGQATYVYLRDLRTRRWVKEAGGRYVLTSEGAGELALFQTPSPPGMAVLDQVSRR